MQNKDQYYKALKEDNGCHEEIDLGEKFGFDEDTTRRIISALLSEYKIEFVANGACNYSVIKTIKK